MGRLASGMRRVAFVCLCAVVWACTPVYQNHGYVPDDTDLAEVKVGVTTREDVATLIGRPASQGLLTDSGWYYVGSRFQAYAAREDREVWRQVVAISFDAKGVVANVERFGLEKGEVVVISRRVTDSNVKGVSFLRQLMGNVGRLSAADLAR